MQTVIQDERTHFEVLEAMAANRSLAVFGEEAFASEASTLVQSYEGEPALIIATSGTTGNRKLVVTPWAALQARCDIMLKAFGKEAFAVVGHPSRRSAYMGAHSAVLLAVQLGGKAVAVDSWEAVDELGVTFIYTYFNLTPWPGAPKAGKLQHLVMMGAPLREKTRLALSKITGAVVRTCYGSTETGPCTLSDGGPLGLGAVGRSMPGVQVRVVAGQVEVKTPGQATEYLGVGPIAKDGWYQTKDAGYFDDKGELVLTGRIP